MSAADLQKRAERLFLDLLGHEPASWNALVRERCQGDGALEAEVRSLLDHHEATSGGMLDHSALLQLGSGMDARLMVDDASLPPVPDAGGYSLRSVLGAGGMGVVYRAVQQRTDRVVALKVIRRSAATPALLRRFEVEAAMLARLQHPGIAQIFEADVADFGHGPQPFIAMELVDGAPLIEHAERHGLPARERLALLALICDAVQHAHQRGVIHRDLKPGNILVAVDDPPSTAGDRASSRGSSEGVSALPKILDFGVARVIDADHPAQTLHTTAGQLIGTLPYMSPEQVAGDPDAVDTRSDVYALGVILYQLLAGRLPHDVSGRPLPEAARVISDEAPARLSSISRVFRGDVETIVSTALEKDKTRRYQSAADLAGDIRRHLADEPILARSATAMYQLRKFARRHKVVVGAAAAVLLSLAAGAVATIAGTTKGLRAARHERDEALAAKRKAEESQRIAEAAQAAELIQQQAAEREARIAEAVVAFVNNDLLAQAAPVIQPDRDISVRALLDRAAQRIEGRFADEPVIEAAVRQTIGATYLTLDELPAADPLISRALELRRAHLGVEHTNTVNSMIMLAQIRSRQGRFDEARSLTDEALPIAKRILKKDDRIIQRALGIKANICEGRGDLPEAEAARREIFDLRRELYGPDDAQTLSARLDLASMRQARNGGTDAEGEVKAVLEACRRALPEAHPLTLRTLSFLGSMLASRRRFDEALPALAEAHGGLSRSLGPDHADTLESANALAMAHAMAGKFADAEAVLLEALDAARKGRGGEHSLTLTAMTNLAGCYTWQNKFSEALPLLEQALATRARLYGETQPESLSIMDNLASVYGGLGRLEDAERLERRTLEIQERIYSPDHPDLLRTLNNLAAACANVGKNEEAESLYTRAIDGHRRRLNPDPVECGISLVSRGETRVELGRADDAAADLESAVQLLSGAVGDRDPRTQRARRSLQALRDAIAATRPASRPE